MDASSRLQERIDSGVTWGIRALVSTVAGFCFLHRNDVQQLIDSLYSWLLETWLFNSVYFETLWVIMVYPVILSIPKLMDAIPYLDRYKINPKTEWDDRPWVEHIKEAAVYGAPFLFLDTFVVKKYVGVHPHEWEVRRQAGLIQSTRALPDAPPTPGQITLHLLGAFIIYDLLFFLLHLASHKNRFLYLYVHATHHDHEILTSRISNKMTIVERVILVLCANESLKMMGSHPLTRMCFVPVLLYWLMENHLGYDTPWGLHRVVPGGLIGGSARHYQHHMSGHRYYEPFFTYIDDWICPHIAGSKSVNPSTSCSKSD